MANELEQRIGTITDNKTTFPKLDVNGREYSLPASTMMLKKGVFVVIPNAVNEATEQNIIAVRDFIKPKTKRGQKKDATQE